TALPLGTPVKAVRTKPGVGSPARAATPISIPPPDGQPPTPTPLPPPPPGPKPVAVEPAVGRSSRVTSQRLQVKPPSAAPPFGQVIAERGKKPAPKKTWMIVAGIVLAGAAATAVTLVMTRGQEVTAVSEDPKPAVSPRTVGTVKFNT